MNTQRVSLVTLAVANVPRSLAFYEAWGWTPAFVDGEDFVVFQCGGIALALFPHRALAEDAGFPLGTPGTTTVAVSQNYPNEAEVDAAFSAAIAAGAREVKAPRSATWGGYSGYMADPDGHLWEIACNPGWPVADDGSINVRAAGEGV